jgi:hypothetical protein
VRFALTGELRPAPARKNHPETKATRSLRARNRLNRRFASL